tara:strand:- start:99 stop:848 length:750 start_codon:yes stop_codon:yes gene_type:complete
MKKFELKNYIRENIISTLSEDTEAEIAKTKELTSAIKDLEVAKKEAGIEEANIGLDDLQDIGYDDGEYAFDKHFNKSQLNNRLDTKYYTRGFVQAINDRAESLRLNENATPLMKDFTYDYEDIGQFYLEGFGKEHTLNNDQLGKLGKKITDNLYGGDIGKAYDAVVNPHKNPYDIKEDEDKEPSKSDIKKTKGLAKAKEELALLTREMKSLAKKYSKAEGEEKEKLVKTLKAKTKLKKELESILDKKKI